MANWAELSKMDWENNHGGDKFPGMDAITIGCLQRIADAAEKMAATKNQYYLRRIAALQGVITKLKKQKEGE